MQVVGLWILAAVVALLMLAIVSVALLSSRTDEVVRPEVPSWSLPSPRDLADPHFPLAWQGYDPDHVDAWIEGVRLAQEELWAALGPTGIADLRAQLDAARARRTPTETVPPAAPGEVPPAALGEVPPAAPGEVPPAAPGDEDTGEMAVPAGGHGSDEESLFLRRTAEPPPTIIPKVRVEERDDLR